MLRTSIPTFAVVAACLSIASACDPNFHQNRIARRAPAASSSSSSSSSSARGGAKTTSATAAASTVAAGTGGGAAPGCTPYSLPAVAALQAANAFPAIWQIANLSWPGVSSEATALFQSLNSTIPNISPRGTPTGDFTGVVYDGVTDPDCWWSYKLCTTPKLAGLQPDITRCEEPNTWGYTLDDGPNCTHNAFYDYLNSVKQKATLFYIGSNVLDWPNEAQRGLNDGHEICAHTWSHRYMTSLSNEQVFAELYFSKKAIKDVIGVTVQCWRPPYGDVDDRVRYVAQALGMSTVIWEDNTFDYEWSTLGLPAVAQNYDSILAKQANGTYNTVGTIVLSHELDNVTMSEAQLYLPKIQAAFAHVMPVGVCSNNTQPYIEKSITYPNFAQYASGTRTVSLVSATAVSVDAPLSIPLSTGASPSSVIATIPYAASGTSSPKSGSNGKGAGFRTTEVNGLLVSAIVASVVGGFVLGAFNL